MHPRSESTPTQPPDHGEPFDRLLEQVGRVNRIQAALRSTLNLDDIYSIILTMLISRATLGFSRALLLGYDRNEGQFRALTALGAPDKAEHERLHVEIAREESHLASMVRNLNALPVDENEESIFQRSLRELSDHSFWITTFQKFSEHNALLDALSELRINCPGLVQNSPPAAAEPCRMLEHLLDAGQARVLQPAEIEASDLPEPLKAIFGGPALVAPVQPNKGPMLILIADRAYEEEPGMNPADRLHVDWLISQVELALENAQMYSDLQSAFDSLRELDQVKSNFLATISHELRTPLTAINGYIQLLVGNKVGPISAGQKEILERVQAHSDLLTGKVNDLIEIAELDTDTDADLTLEPVDPLNAIMTIMPKIESRRAHKGITVEPRVVSPIPRVLGNLQALERIFLHLLDNAIKFSQQGGHVRIEFEHDGPDLRISIADEGIGISQSQRERIFEAFYQIDNQLTRTYEGLGIGLTVIKKQLDLSGGRIEVQSELGHGSCFTVIYPVAESQQAPPAP